MAVFGPPQPAAVAVMVVVPAQPAVKLTAPVEATMLLPPDMLVPSMLYVMPVELVAVAVYVTVPVPWQRVDEAPITNMGVPTVGVIVTTWVAVVGPPQPVAMAVMVVVPPHPAK